MQSVTGCYVSQRGGNSFALYHQVMFAVLYHHSQPGKSLWIPSNLDAISDG
jgi:hypothetical protein